MKIIKKQRTPKISNKALLSLGLVAKTDNEIYVLSTIKCIVTVLKGM